MGKGLKTKIKGKKKKDFIFKHLAELNSSIKGQGLHLDSGSCWSVYFLSVYLKKM